MINTVRTLKHLIHLLDTSNPSEYVSIIKKIKIPVSEFIPYTSWKKSSYTRNCIKRSDDYELILICWDKHAKTPIHGHNGQKCWVYHLHGEIIENRYGEVEPNKLVEISNGKLRMNALAFMDDKMGYHQLINMTDGKALTLHIYANPIDKCEVFDKSTKRFNKKQLHYDTKIKETQIKLN